MLERRCNFCGDLLPTDGDREHKVTIPHAKGEFVIHINVGHDLPTAYNDDPDTRLNPFYYFQHNKPKREDTFDTCFGCAADLVAVARDQYAKEKR